MASVRRTHTKKKKALARKRVGKRIGTQVRSLTKPLVKPAPPRSVTIEPLDPWLICGPDTSVEELWRVKEQAGTVKTFHLVFFDKYGWYCEHGRECRAVSDVRRLVKELGVTWTADYTRIAKKTA